MYGMQRKRSCMSSSYAKRICKYLGKESVYELIKKSLHVNKLYVELGKDHFTNDNDVSHAV